MFKITYDGNGLFFGFSFSDAHGAYDATEALSGGLRGLFKSNNAETHCYNLTTPISDFLIRVV